MRVAGLFDTEFVCVQSVITPALSEREGTVSEEKSDVHEGFPVEASSDVPSPSASVHLIRLWSCQLCEVSSCLVIVNVVDFPF